jgi:hypothetical protein
MFQQILTRTADYSVLAMPNLNGDYLSDACAAQVGGLGMAPGANFGDGVALFEATHGTAPKYADQDKVNPGSLLLSGSFLLDHLGWTEACTAVEQALEKTILQKRVTYDLARLLGGVTPVRTSEFATAIIENLPEWRILPRCSSRPGFGWTWRFPGAAMPWLRWATSSAARTRPPGRECSMISRGGSRWVPPASGTASRFPTRAWSLSRPCGWPSSGRRLR